MKHIIDYRGFTIFKVADKNYAIKMDTPDGLIPVGGEHTTCLEAIVAINRGLPKASVPDDKSKICKLIIDFFNISA